MREDPRMRTGGSLVRKYVPVTNLDWLIAIALAASLAVAHLTASKVAAWPQKTQDSLASVGGGVAIAYVFVHLMPELATGGKELSDANVVPFAPTPVAEATLFLVALIGLVIYFALDVRSDEGRLSTKRAFRIHLVSFAVISGLYAYTMPSLVSTGWDYAVLLTSVVFAHTLLADRALARAHPHQFNYETRWVGIVAIVLGLAAAYFLPPASDVALAIATAFLGGSLLMTTFREELPAASRARLPWFLLGTAVMTGLLIFVLDISSRGHAA